MKGSEGMRGLCGMLQIATGMETSIRELATMVQEVADKAVEMRYGPARQGDIQRNYSAVGKVQRMLGWEPQIDLKTGLRETWLRFGRYVE